MHLLFKLRISRMNLFYYKKIAKEQALAGLRATPPAWLVIPMVGLTQNKKARLRRVIFYEPKTV